RKRAALALHEAGERDLREVVGAGDADAGVGRDERLLGLADIGTVLDQRSRQAGRNLRRQAEIVHRFAARDGAGSAAEKQAERVFRQPDAALGARYLRRSGVEELLGLAHVQTGSRAVL